MKDNGIDELDFEAQNAALALIELKKTVEETADEFPKLLEEYNKTGNPTKIAESIAKTIYGENFTQAQQDQI